MLQVLALPGTLPVRHRCSGCPGYCCMRRRHGDIWQHASFLRPQIGECSIYGNPCYVLCVQMVKISTFLNLMTA